MTQKKMFSLQYRAGLTKVTDKFVSKELSLGNSVAVLDTCSFDSGIISKNRSKSYL